MRLFRLLVVAVFVVAISADVYALGCGSRCNREYNGDAASCENARYFGQANCRIITTCTVVIFDADGPFGPASPTLQWQCSYDCDFDPCIWV